MRDAFNATRFERGSQAGHYESWFQRANHPTRPEAFWIRYTIFSPKGRPEDAIGELWAIHFRRDGEHTRVVAVREEHPIDACTFATSGIDTSIADARLRDGMLTGRAATSDHAIAWDLTYKGGTRPLLLLPERLYAGGFPKAKALVGTPLCTYRGHLEVDSERVDIDGWVGSQNHNWGSKHTDEYAWGQVAGFDDEPDAFLEVSTARVHLGPIKTPWLTPIVLRIGDREFAVNALLRAVRNKGRYDTRTLEWQFSGSHDGTHIEGRVSAPRNSFVALPYGNPPGGVKTCLNCKLASCELHLTEGGRSRRLYTAHRAAFEIGTDATDHGVALAF